MKAIHPSDYYTDSQWKAIKTELDKHPTPNLVVDLAIIEKGYKDLKNNFPFAKVFYAVKANPIPEAMRHLLKLGTNFDVASIYELDEVLSNGGSPDKISFGNTIKKQEDIKYAYDKGVRLFVSDSFSDLKNIAKYAPGANVFFRVIFDGHNKADWPLSYKFGAKEEIVQDLIPFAKSLGLKPRGLSFHVGSQQNDPNAWCMAIERAAKIFKQSKEKDDIELDLINLGGGLPANYIKNNKKIDEYARVIKGCLNQYFPDGLPKNIIMEPGRSLFGNCGVLKTRVILVAEKEKNSNDRWLYVDSGLYGGLIETLGESIKYPLYTEKNGTLSQNFIIAGPTCDSIDVMYKNFRNPLPENIDINDNIYWFTSGAYVGSCASVGFNGFPPLKTYVVNSNESGKKIDKKGNVYLSFGKNNHLENGFYLKFGLFIFVAFILFMLFRFFWNKKSKKIKVKSNKEKLNNINYENDDVERELGEV